LVKVNLEGALEVSFGFLVKVNLEGALEVSGMHS